MHTKYAYAPIVTKCRTDCPRRKRMTTQQWRQFFVINATAVQDRAWGYLATLSGCKPATVAAQWRKLHPTGATRQVASVDDYPLRQTDWTQDEIDLLVALVSDGSYSPRVIANRLHRTVDACHTKYGQVQRGECPVPATTGLPKWNAPYRKQQHDKQTCLAQLKVQQRIHRMYSEGRSSANIAATIGWTVSAVKAELAEG